MAVDRNGLEILDRDECLMLLGEATLGRVGISVGALPTILPVNFRLVDDHVLFRTSTGSKFSAATDNAVVAFEVDEMDPVDHTGWSVVVTGVAQLLGPEALTPKAASSIPRWAPDGDSQIVSVSTQLISGRRLTLRRPDGPSAHRDLTPTTLGSAPTA